MGIRLAWFKITVDRERSREKKIMELTVVRLVCQSAHYQRKWTVAASDISNNNNKKNGRIRNHNDHWTERGEKKKLGLAHFFFYFIHYICLHQQYWVYVWNCALFAFNRMQLDNNNNNKTGWICSSLNLCQFISNGAIRGIPQMQFHFSMKVHRAHCTNYQINYMNLKYEKKHSKFQNL